MANKKASSIIIDALNLSNLANSSFASHKELREYINDGFTSLYNELANKGNDYWLKEAYAQRATEDSNYWLPRDFYRAKRISAGNYLVPRKTNSANGYSIRNGQLHLDGYYGFVKLEYYPKPTFISFPSSNIELASPININADHAMTFGPYVVDADKTVINLETKEEFDASAIPSEVNIMGDGWLASVNSHGEKELYDFRGNSLGVTMQGSGYFILGSSGLPYAKWYDNGDDVTAIWNALIDSEGPFMTFPGDNNFLMLVNDSDENIPGVWYCDADGDNILKWHFLDKEGNDYSVDAGELNSWGQFRFGYLPDWSDNSIYVSSGNKVAILTPNLETGYLDMVEYRVKGVMNSGLVKYNDNYYFLTTDLSKQYLQGYEPDTLMEYPTNVFYRALAAYIAIQLLAKQGTDTTNMQASFSSLVNTLTKSEDNSSDYPVIKNAYY